MSKVTFSAREKEQLVAAIDLKLTSLTRAHKSAMPELAGGYSGLIAGYEALKMKVRSLDET